MLHKEIPFLRIGLPLCAGIITGLYFKPDVVFLVIVAFVSIPGFISSLINHKPQANLLFGFSLTITLFTCGLLLYTNEKERISALKPIQTIFSCTLSDYPAGKQNSYILTVKLNSMKEGYKTVSIKGSMLLYSKKDTIISSLLPGDMLIINVLLSEITNRGNPYEFDYSFYMENQGIKYYAFTNSRDIISHISPAPQETDS